MFSSSAPASSFSGVNSRKKKQPSADVHLPPLTRPGSARNRSSSRPGHKASSTALTAGPMPAAPRRPLAAAATHRSPSSARRAASLASSVGLVAASRAAGRAHNGGSLQAKREAVWLRVLRQRAQGREVLRLHGDTAAAIKELHKALTLQASTPGGLLDPVGATSKGVVPAGTPYVEAAWYCAEEIVHLANDEAVHGVATAASSEDIHRSFREAFKLLCNAEDTVEEMLEGDSLGILAAPSTVTVVDGLSSSARNARPASSRSRGGRLGAPPPSSSSATAAVPMWRQGPDYFQSFPELRPSLLAVVLNNVAVYKQSVGRPPAEVLRVLQRAALKGKGVVATGILYNIAVVLAEQGKTQQSLEAAARCVEQCAACLKVDPRGEAETELEAAELADTYTTFVASVAAHMIACQLFMAALYAHGAEAAPGTASMSAEAEVMHCQQAAACAKAFLPATHPLQRRTAARLAAARLRKDEADSTTPADALSLPTPPPLQWPLLPLHIMYTYSASPMLTAATPATPPVDAEMATCWTEYTAEAERDAAFMGPAATTQDGGAYGEPLRTPNVPEAASFDAVMLSRMLLLWGVVKVPSKVRGYLAKAAKQLARFQEKRAASLAATAVANASATREGHLRSPATSRLRPSSASRGSSRSRTPSPGFPSSAMADEHLTPRPASRASAYVSEAAASGGGSQRVLAIESVPAPLITTELPRVAFNRYEVLKRNALHYLDEVTTAIDTVAGATEAGAPLHQGPTTNELSGARTLTPTLPTPPLMQDGSFDWESAQRRRRRVSTLYYAVSKAEDTHEGTSGSTGMYLSVKDATLGHLAENRSFIAAAESAAMDHSEQRVKDNVYATSIADATRHAAPVVTATLTVMKATEQMRTMDAELLRYSRLVVDILPEIRHAAACTIQRCWQQYQARMLRKRRLAEVAEWQRKSEAAAIVLSAYRTYRACQPAKDELHRLQAIWARHQHATLIQSYLRQKQSVEAWGLRCVAVHERLLAEKKHRELREASAMTLQSWWRMARTRAVYQRQCHAALVLQGACRQYAARRELTRRRVLKRLAYEEYLRQHRHHIIYIQRWYRACVARIAVNGLLEQRREAVAAYITDQETSFRDGMGAWAEDLDRAGRAMETILAVLHGAQARRVMHERHVAMERIRGVLTRWVLRLRGRETIERLRTDRRTALALQRRREEVLDATLRIQATTRRWLLHRRQVASQEAERLLHQRAAVIQAAYRAYRQRCAGSTALAWRAQNHAQEEADRMERLREYSAAKIQATYRMHMTRQHLADFLQFMLVDRHVMARRIQRAWFAHTARRRLAQRRELVEELARRRQRAAYERVSVVKAQSVVRMFLARCRVQRLLQEASATAAAVEWHTPYQRYAAARRIQAAWRGYAARWHTHHVRLAAAHRATEKTSLESLHAYATIIQKVVRARLLQRRPHSPSAAADVAAVLPASEENRASTSNMSNSNLPRQPELLPRPPLHPLRPSLSAGAGRRGAAARARSRLWVSRPCSAPSAIAAQVQRPTVLVQSRSSEVQMEVVYEVEELADDTVVGAQMEAAVDHGMATPTVSRSCPPMAVMESATPREPPVCEARYSSTACLESTSVAENDAPATDVEGDDTGATSISTHSEPAAEPQGTSTDAMGDVAETQTRVYTEEEIRSAIVIQKIWRGYRVRTTIEYYYEEVEVDETDSDQPSEHDDTKTYSDKDNGPEEDGSDNGSDGTEESEESEESIDRAEQETFHTLDPKACARADNSFSLASGRPILSEVEHTLSPVDFPVAGRSVRHSEQTHEHHTQRAETRATTRSTATATTTFTTTTTTTVTSRTKTFVSANTVLTGESQHNREAATWSQMPVDASDPPTVVMPARRRNTVAGYFPPPETYTPEQHAAATLIQKIWRGYFIRCTYEFYYEEYEEEVSVHSEDA